MLVEIKRVGRIVGSIFVPLCTIKGHINTRKGHNDMSLLLLSILYDF